MTMPLTRSELKQLYRKRADRYDLSANLYHLIGFNEHKYRRMAIDALRLKRGATVVEIGCGTGLNFSLLEKAIGPEGRIIGVDLTDSMLRKARGRVERQGWPNVELIEVDAGEYRFPENVDGIISTLALTLIPSYDNIIKNGAEALIEGGRFVVLDIKKPGNLPE